MALPQNDHNLKLRQEILENASHPVVKLAFEVGPKYGVDIKNRPEVLSQLIKNFGKLALAVGALDEKQHELDREKFKDKKFLDLACGSEVLPVPTKNRFAPWLCRTLSYLGADVTGVDLYYPILKKVKRKKRPMINEPSAETGWHFVQRDLTQMGAIDASVFPDGVFDAVACIGFIGYSDVTLDDPHIKSIRLEDPQRYIDIIVEIDTQVTRVLKEAGIYARNDSVFQKKGDDLKHL